MNKKRLSVVMAGAMLASSVAPVLAAEVKSYEVSSNDLGLLTAKLREVMESKKFHTTDKNKDLAGKSIYKLTKGLNPVDVTLESVKTLNVGDTITLWDQGHRVDDKGNYFSTTTEKTEVAKKWSETDLINAANKIVADMENDSDKRTYKVIKDAKFDSTKNILDVELYTGKVLTFKVGDDRVNFIAPIDKDGYELENKDANAQLVVGFKKVVTEKNPGQDIDATKIAEIKIVEGGNAYKVEDLYDGLMLTTKGHELLSIMKEAGDKVWMYDDNTSLYVPYTGELKADHGVYRFHIETIDAFNKKSVYKVTGTDENAAETLAKWLVNKDPKVDLLAGDNRYETAVTIAKDVANIKSVINNKEIVLVNGDSLVDGLAAAPLAANYGVHTPILLTESNKLPAATKEYLKELISQVPVGKLNEVNIKIVGGTSVVSKAVEKELKGYGFDVDRFGGANREETSLLVAEEIGEGKDAFVVGAEGEADAMSIAAYAASQRQPIVVAKKGGISEEALETLEDVKVTVIGGESVVSANEYKEIKAVAKAVTRVSGSNRQATNAEIIARYYTNDFAGAAKNVVVAKDGQKNKSELIDALAATTLASKNNAPIVLATNKLSNAQINALELNANFANAVYQVGHGVARDIVKTIATRLGVIK
ncbi:cell wall-binding repeat-containing protein [Peptacetobacter sp. AB845]|uniref:cell wall-binding repeat-containing protein n=1 Tax=Peptacetobacter sp. AB845 TaxID=3388429 RepID=UPI0039C95364